MRKILNKSCSRIFTSVVVIAIIVVSLILSCSHEDASVRRKTRYGPYISDYLSLSYSTQYDNPIDNRDETPQDYYLSQKETKHALAVLRTTIRNSERISCDLITGHPDKIVKYSYDADVEPLKKELYDTIDLRGRPRIPRLLAYLSPPNMVLTLYPSEIKINIYIHPEFCYINWKNGVQRFEGSFSQEFLRACLNVKDKSGVTALDWLETANSSL